MRDLDNPAIRILLEHITRLGFADRDIRALGVLRAQDVGDALVRADAAAGDVLLAVCDFVVLIGPDVDSGDIADVDSSARAVSCWENACLAGENGVKWLESLVELGWRRGDEDGGAYDDGGVDSGDGKGWLW